MLQTGRLYRQLSYTASRWWCILKTKQNTINIYKLMNVEISHCMYRCIVCYNLTGVFSETDQPLRWYPNDSRRRRIGTEFSRKCCTLTFWYKNCSVRWKDCRTTYITQKSFMLSFFRHDLCCSLCCMYQTYFYIRFKYVYSKCVICDWSVCIHKISLECVFHKNMNMVIWIWTHIKHTFWFIRMH